MPIPQLSDAPPPPLRTQTPGTFTPTAETFVEWQAETFTPEMQAVIDAINALGLDPADIPDAVTDLSMATARLIGRTSVGTGPAEELTAAQVRSLIGLASTLTAPPTWDFNFAGNGYQVIRAQVAMTITQQATSGTGSVSYEKSTAAAPNTFSSTTSPIALEAGAKLKVTASGVTATYAVHLERTA